MPTLWADLTLFDETDWNGEVGSKNFLLPPNGDASFFERNKANAKAMLETELLVELPPLFKAFVGTDYYQGYSLSELDAILDKLLNPEVLKRTAIAATVLSMIDELSISFKMGQERNMDYYISLRDIWKEKYKIRMSQAVKLLKPDLSQNGTIEDDERTTTKPLWFRI